MTILSYEYDESIPQTPRTGKTEFKIRHYDRKASTGDNRVACLTLSNLCLDLEIFSFVVKVVSGGSLFRRPLRSHVNRGSLVVLFPNDIILPLFFVKLEISYLLGKPTLNY